MTFRKIYPGQRDPNQNGAKEFVDAFATFRKLRDDKINADRDYGLNQDKVKELVRAARVKEMTDGFGDDPATGGVAPSADYWTPGKPMYERAAQDAAFKRMGTNAKGAGGAILKAGEYGRLKKHFADGSPLEDDLKDLPLNPSYGFGNMKAQELGATDEMLRGIVGGKALPGNPQIPKAAIPLYRRNPNETPIDDQQQADWENATGARPGSGKNLRIGNFATGMSQMARDRSQDARQDKSLGSAQKIAQDKIDEKRRLKAEKDAKALEQSQNTAGIVTEDIGRALDMAKNSEFAVGPWVGQTHRIPGTPAYNLNNLLDTIRANIALDKLQKMREASPTGGALGNVSDFENKLLQATAGKLDVTMSQPDFELNANRLLDQYNKVINEGIPDDGSFDNPSDQRARGTRKAAPPPGDDGVPGNPSDRRAKGVDKASSAAALGVKAKDLAAMDKMAPPPKSQKTVEAKVAIVKPGEVHEGYRFKGGNPGDQKNWEKVK